MILNDLPLLFSKSISAFGFTFFGFYSTLKTKPTNFIPKALLFLTYGTIIFLFYFSL